ncbi:MAG: hypothetical protein AAFQ82_12790 [Myxococcota bacterium]
MSNASKIVHELQALLRPMVAEHRMSPVAWPEEITLAEGSWARTRVKLQTEVHRGEGFLSRLQVATVTSPDDTMAALTAVAVPSPELSAPVFGCDLVAFRGRFVLAALDLSGGKSTSEDAHRLEMARMQLVSVAEPRPVPDFGVSCFSPHATLVAESSQPLDEALPNAFRTYLSCFAHRMTRSPIRSWEQGREEQRRYFAAMRANKRESKAMGKLFGASWAKRYFEDYFFCDSLEEFGSGGRDVPLPSSSEGSGAPELTAMSA